MKKSVMFFVFIIGIISFTSAFEFCEDGTQGENELRLISVDDMLKDNSKEWVWQTFQNVEIEARVENKGDESADYILEAVFVDGEDVVGIVENEDNLREEFSLASGERKSISLNLEIDEDAEEGEYRLYVKFYRSGNEDSECVENSEENIQIERINLCENGEVDRDELEILKITDTKENNEIEWEWTPGKEIGVSVNLKNKEYSQRNFIVELIMLDEENNQIDFSENKQDTIEEIELDKDEEGNIEFYFSLKTDIKEADYTLYAKTYDEEDEDICTTLKAEEKSNPKIISVERPERSVEIEKIEGPRETTTNSEINYMATIINMGSRDENRVALLIYNQELGIKEIIETDNLLSGETRDLTFTLKIPENASATTYPILFSTQFEYSDKTERYKQASDSDESTKIYLVVIQAEIVEEPKEIAIENETIKEEYANESITENETTTSSGKITGNVVGTSSSKGSFWLATISLILIAGIGVFLLFRRKQKRARMSQVEPRIVRRHAARLGQPNT